VIPALRHEIKQEIVTVKMASTKIPQKLIDSVIDVPLNVLPARVKIIVKRVLVKIETFLMSVNV
jgi:hypothetical protein